MPSNGKHISGSYQTSPASTASENRLSPKISNQPSMAAANETRTLLHQPRLNHTILREALTMPLSSPRDSYIASGTQMREAHRHRGSTAQLKMDFQPQHLDTQSAVEDFAVSKSAKIRANTTGQWLLNEDFEVLPAGALGTRPEMQNATSNTASSEQEPRRHNMLRKKHAVSKFR